MVSLHAVDARLLLRTRNEVGLDFDGSELHALFSKGVYKPLVQVVQSWNGIQYELLLTTTMFIQLSDLIFANTLQVGWQTKAGVNLTPYWGQNVYNETWHYLPGIYR
jgi:hypothetical protein